MKRKKTKYLYLTLISTIVFFYACEKTSIVPETVGNVTFSADIQPIFTAKCIGCHGGSQSPDLRATAAYNSLINGGYVNKAVPADSKIVKQLNTSSHTAHASALEKQKILQWITQGAKKE